MKPLTSLATAAASALLVCGSAQAVPISYTATLLGAVEEPANASPGTGSATVVFDSDAHTLAVKATFSGLIGSVTASHIHAPTAAPFSGIAGVATPTPTFPGFPTGVTAGTYSQTFDLTLASSWRSGFITANGGTTASAEAAFGEFLAQGRAYFNIHTSSFPGGEIRGFLTPTVPDISMTAPLFLLALGSLQLFGRRNRS